jgi:hypothetical protein
MMTNRTASHSEKAWSAIEKEKRIDGIVRRVSIAAWTTTFILVSLFAVIVGVQVVEMMAAVQAGVAPRAAIIGSAMPLLVVLGVLSLLIATLSTVGVFLRLRTASLAEIQLRLAALEDMLASRPDSPQSDRG